LCTPRPSPPRAARWRPEFDDESHQESLPERSSTEQAIDADLLLHTLVEAQVDRTPDVVAIRFEGRELCYRELDTLANQVAEHLLERGAQVGELVGVQMERSCELVIAILGLLKAGCGYVPIDPTYPLCRRRFIAQDTGLRHVLVRASDKDPGLPAAPLAVSAEGHGVPRRPTVEVPGTAPAYVIYTSGSTGVAKGVIIPHQAVRNRMAWIRSAILLGPDDAVLHKTPCTFDVSLSKIFWPLVAGARLVVARAEGHREPRYLADLILSERVTVVDFVPSMLAAFLDDPLAPRCQSLRVVVSGGEALSWTLRSRLFEVLPRVPIALLLSASRSRNRSSLAVSGGVCGWATQSRVASRVTVIMDRLPSDFAIQSI
jgi:non-ribosomal peptide synthetase component F